MVAQWRWKKGSDVAALRRLDLKAATQFAKGDTRNLGADHSTEPNYKKILDIAKQDYFNNTRKIKTKNLAEISQLNISRLLPHKRDAINHFISLHAPSGKIIKAINAAARRRDICNDDIFHISQKILYDFCASYYFSTPLDEELGAQNALVDVANTISDLAIQILQLDTRSRAIISRYLLMGADQEGDEAHILSKILTRINIPEQLLSKSILYEFIDERESKQTEDEKYTYDLSTQEKWDIAATRFLALLQIVVIDSAFLLNTSESNHNRKGKNRLQIAVHGACSDFINLYRKYYFGHVGNPSLTILLTDLLLPLLPKEAQGEASREISRFLRSQKRRLVKASF